MRFFAYVLYTLGIILVILVNFISFPKVSDESDWKRVELEMRMKMIERRLDMEPENVELLMELAELYSKMNYERSISPR